MKLCNISKFSKVNFSGLTGLYIMEQIWTGSIFQACSSYPNIRQSIVYDKKCQSAVRISIFLVCFCKYLKINMLSIYY